MGGGSKPPVQIRDQSHHMYVFTFDPCVAEPTNGRAYATVLHLSVAVVCDCDVIY